ncbi:MAG: cobalamin-binding protein [Desulfomonilia bacterium]
MDETIMSGLYIPVHRYHRHLVWCVKLILFSCITLCSLHAGALSCGASGPERIISLAPSLTRELYDLGAEEAIVGVTHYRPEDAASKEVVGSLTKLNIERILALQPDLVLASKDCNRITDIERLTRLGLQVSVFQGCESFSCMCAEFIRLGELVGKRDIAEVTVRELNAELSGIQSSIKENPSLKVFWQIGADPLITANDETFSGEFIRRAECINIFGDLNVRYPRVHREEVIRRNPDVIIIVTHMSTQESASIWQDMETVTAVRNKRVHTLPADLVCQPTPVSFVEAYRAVLAILHPGLP